MGEHLTDTNQKERRDQFFCELARRQLKADESDEDGWVALSEVTETPSDTESEIKGFLERLLADGWIEVKDPAQAGALHARLTSAGRARAQVICKDGPFAP